MPEKVFSTRMDDELQREFRSIVVRKGKTVGSVICQLVKEYIVREGGTVPMIGNAAPHEPNAETIAAMEEALNDLGEEITLDELKAQLDAIR